MRRFGWSLLFVGLSALACSGDDPEGDQPLLTAEVVSTGDGLSPAGKDASLDGLASNELPPVAVDTDAPAEAAPIPFQLCAENADCPSGYCVESKDGRTCTRTCVSDCPDGWRCTDVSGTGSDVVFLCVPRFVTLCMPCANDSECADDGGLGDSKCLSYGPEGQFCGAACSPEQADCPTGYACDEGQCRLEQGICECTWKAIKEGASTPCTATNEAGSCLGARGCLEGALSTCDARTPGVESCNGLDDDCDGVTDEALPQDACSQTTAAGTCTGVFTCANGSPVCSALLPVAELCDGLDNDCDTLADEGFLDSDLDGTPDCISADDDGDGIPDVEDNCPAIANFDQNDLDHDGAGDLCDPDLDGDGDPNTTDCAPADPAIGKLATEACNGVDDDCDLVIDEGFSDLDKDTVADCQDEDDDGDTVADLVDNCPVTPNSDQTDGDGDGKGDGCEDDIDGDSDPDVTDCAPQDPQVRHGAPEACNGADENCNGIVDEGFPDSDQDGVMDCLDTDDDGDSVPDIDDDCPLKSDAEQIDTDGDLAGDVCDTDDDGDGTSDIIDCGPLDPSVNPKAAETCNGKDDDCDALADEAGALGCTDFLFDNDGDGFGIGSAAQCLCGPKTPFTATSAGDCNDQNSFTFPGATESCNQQDDDCDELKDEGAAVGCVDAYVDADKDGVGAGTPSCTCPGTVGVSSFGGDCADLDPSVKPGALESCNGKDDNCNGQTDEPGSVGCQSYFKDVDSDGVGQVGEVRCLCAADEASSFTAFLGGDCNDLDEEIAPAHPEACDLKDNNCNGQIDEGVQTTWFLDEDNDGYGASYSSKLACAAPTGHVAKAGDCIDFNPDIHPQAPEACNEIDDDCDGLKDEGLAVTTIYKDNDGDGVAAKNATKQDKCDVPIGWAITVDRTGDGVFDWDCDESDGTVQPGGATICGDGKDNDCDGIPERLCFTSCGGEWPYAPDYTTDAPSATIADLHGDGSAEVLVNHAFGFGILQADGHPLYDYSAPTANYARTPPVLADIDNNDAFGFDIQSLEILTGNGSVSRFYKVSPSGTVTVIEHPLQVYDASKFMARDLDYDGKPEFVTATWCEPNGTKIFRFTPPATITLVREIASPNAACQYYDGRSLTDLNGDGVPEMVWGDGYPVANAPSYWAGRIFAESFTNTSTLTSAPFCSGAACFPVDLAGQFPGGVNDLLRLPEEIRTLSIYFLSNVAGAQNPSGVVTSRYAVDGSRLSQAAGNSLWNGLSDVDDDGTPENFGSDIANLGLYDVNGDGFPDRLTSSGKSLRIQLWDKATKNFVTNAGSDFLVSSQPIGVRAVSDIDGDGRLQVISSDAAGSVYCHELGPSTWDVGAILPPTMTAAYRTWQWDNYEPNNGKDTNADGMPDQTVRIPSALTAGGPFYSYISTSGDEDYFTVDADWSARICLRSPKSKNYSLHIYSAIDRWNNVTHAPGADAKPDGLIWESTDTSGTKCFSASNVNPYRQGEFKFVVGVRGVGGAHSMHWPYFIQTPK